MLGGGDGCADGGGGGISGVGVGVCSVGVGTGVDGLAARVLGVPGRHPVAGGGASVPRGPTRGIEPRTPTAGCCRGGPPSGDNCGVPVPCPAIPRAARASYGRAGSPEKATKWRVRGRRGHGKHRQHARRRVSAPLATCARERAHQNLHMAMRNVTGGVRIETNYMPVWVCHSRQSQHIGAGAVASAHLVSSSLAILSLCILTSGLDIRFLGPSTPQMTARSDSNLHSRAERR